MKFQKIFFEELQNVGYTVRSLHVWPHKRSQNVLKLQLAFQSLLCPEKSVVQRLQRFDLRAKKKYSRRKSKSVLHIRKSILTFTVCTLTAKWHYVLLRNCVRYFTRVKNSVTFESLRKIDIGKVIFLAGLKMIHRKLFWKIRFSMKTLITLKNQIIKSEKRFSCICKIKMIKAAIRNAVLDEAISILKNVTATSH